MATEERVASEVATQEPPVDRTWEPLTITVVGSLGDVMQGGTGTRGDGGVQTMN
jgi:hypothetical protein